MDQAYFLQISIQRSFHSMVDEQTLAITLPLFELYFNNTVLCVLHHYYGCPCRFLLTLAVQCGRTAMPAVHMHTQNIEIAERDESHELAIQSVHEGRQQRLLPST
ncbi:hypothetical protein CBL_04583 [Carabus blaptoides fortunei]